MASAASDLSIDKLAAAAESTQESRLAAIAIVPRGAEQPVGPQHESPFHLRKLSPPPAEEEIDKQAEAGRRVARNLGALVGGQAITWTFTLIWTLIVPRAIGPVEFGILVSAQSVSGVLGIALGVGARDYLVRETVVAPAEGPKLVGSVFVLRLILAPVVALAALVWARLANYGQDATIVLCLITVMTVFTWLLDAVQAAFQALERMKYIAYGNVITKAAQGITGIALVIAGVKVVGIAAGMAIIAGFVILLSCLWLRPYFRIDIRTNVSLVTRVTKESAAYWATGLFWMVYFWIDTIMLTLMTNSTTVGWYGASTQLFQTLMFLPALVTTAWLPRLVTAFGRGPRALHETARTPVELVLMLSMPIAAGTVIVADALIRAVYGSEYAQAAPVLIVLALCVPPLYLNIILSSILIAAKRQARWTIVMAGAALVNPLFNLVLIPITAHQSHNGAIGAGISLVLTELLMSAVGLLLVGRHVFQWRMVRRCASMSVASAGMVAAGVLARPAGTVPSWLGGVITFGLLGLMLRIVRQEEVARARSAVAQVQARAMRNRAR